MNLQNAKYEKKHENILKIKSVTIHFLFKKNIK